MHWIDSAVFFAWVIAGKSIATRIAMIAMTTSNSIKVKRHGDDLLDIQASNCNNIA